MKIATKRKRIEKKLTALHQELKQLQEECTHDNSTYKAGGNTGNWSASDDWYWYDWDCPDCGKWWTTEQSYQLTIGKKEKR